MKVSAKQKKWFISIAVVGILVVLVGVFFQSNQLLLVKAVPEDSLASALKKLNNDLLEAPKLVSGQISAEANVTGTVAGSDLKVAIQSDEEKNSVSYAGTISAETLVYAINRLFGEKYHSDVLESISLYSQSDELLLTEKGNQTASFLTFNSLGLSPFLKGNKQYFSIPANVSEFHQKLEGLGIRTTFDLSEKESDVPRHRLKIDTVYVTLKELVNLLPIKINDTTNLNQKISFQFIQNDETQTIEAVKVGLLNYQLTKQLNSYSELDMTSNVVLEFDLADLEAK